MLRIRLRLQPLLWGGLLLGGAAWGADPPKPPAPANPFAQQEQGMLAHLKEAVTWYHESQAGSGWIFHAGDAFYWTSQRASANDALKSAFASAQAVVVLIARQAPPAVSPPAEDARETRLTARLSTNAEQLLNLQRQRTDLDRRIRAAADPAKADLTAQRDVVQAEIDLDSALAQALEKTSALFTRSTGESSSASLAGQIAAWQRAVPEVFDPGAATAPKNQPPISETANAEGIINRTAALISLIRDKAAMVRLIQRTGELEAEANRLADPLGAALRQTVQDGEDASEQAAQITAPEARSAARSKIENFAVQLRDLSAAVLPLRQEAMALERSRNNLAEWRSSLSVQTDAILRILFMHGLAVVATLALLAAISEVWRRATFKYVSDVRRRRQFLLIRRFATGTLMGIVIIMGFVSDFSSLATFAGFITAGIAVALQTVILSVAAYFFLIGRYGVRVGDRVTVSGVTGDVIDIGLVRVFLLELAGTGVDLHPTGRVVVLANSALFSTTPLYKQLPGTEYVWHEVYAALAPDADAALAETRLLAAVNAVYAGYRPSLESQHSAVEQLIDLKLDLPTPGAQLRFADSGLEVGVRYPVEIRRSSEIDGLVTKQVIEAIAQDDAFKKTLAGTPRLRSAVKG